MYGEHLKLDFNGEPIPGSSPHVRGAPHEPALRHSPSWDHPRMYGEHASVTSAMSGSEGSSPHVRGALDKIVLNLDGLGIIPACTGSTLHLIITRPKRGDHPRMYGEHQKLNTRKVLHPGIIPACTGSTVMFVLSPRPELGSSPHVRGALVVALEVKASEGIIPACTGSTELWRDLTLGGEGSSPHVRGAPASLRTST